MSTESFPYDVFLSHSAKDKAVVRPLAERLRQDGGKERQNLEGRRQKLGFILLHSSFILPLTPPARASLAQFLSFLSLTSPVSRVRIRP